VTVLVRALLGTGCMKTARSIVIIGALSLAAVGISAAARAHSRSPEAGTSGSHTAATGWIGTKGAPVESPPASLPPVDPGAAPRLPTQEPEAIDWSNPYDLMLHGIRPGRTHDMR
jgi:hypothetical protein